MSLLLLSTLLLGTYFMAFSRQYMRYDSRQDLILLTEKAMLRIQSLLGDSRASMVTVDSTIHGLSFPVAEGLTGSIRFDSVGAVVWQSWTAFGLDSNGTLWEGRQSFGSAVAPSAGGWNRLPIGHWVREFAITGQANKAFRVRILVQDEHNYQAEFISTVVAQN